MLDTSLTSPAIRFKIALQTQLAPLHRGAVCVVHVHELQGEEGAAGVSQVPDEQAHLRHQQARRGGGFTS
jgi:hypothetical protein